MAGGFHCSIDFQELLSDCDGLVGEDVPGHQGEVEWGHHTYLAHNRLDDTIRLGFVGDGDAGVKFQSQRFVVVENNLFTRVGANIAPTPTIYHWPYTRHVRIRNNVFLGPTGMSTFTPEFSWDIEFAHNTAYSPYNDNYFASFVNRYGDDGVPAMDFMSFFGGPQHSEDAFKIIGNVWAITDYLVDDSDGIGNSQFDCRNLPSMEGLYFRDNVWSLSGNGNEMRTHLGYVGSNGWNTLPFVSGDRFITFRDEDFVTQPPDVSSLDYIKWVPEFKADHEVHQNTNTVPGVFVDFYGHPRPRLGPHTAGAIQ